MSIVTVVLTVLSVAMMLVAVWAATKPQPVRAWRDVARACIGIGGAVAIGVITSAGTQPAVLVLVGAVGFLVGWFRGRVTEVFSVGGRIMARSTPLAVALFTVGLAAMQLAALANRAGVVRVGQVGSVFAAGIGLGLVAGRDPAVRQVAARKAMAATAVGLIVGFVVVPSLGSRHDAAEATSLEGPADVVGVARTASRQGMPSAAPLPPAELCALLGGGEAFFLRDTWSACVNLQTGDLLVDYESAAQSEEYTLSLFGADRVNDCPREGSLSSTCWQGEDIGPVSIGEEGLLSRWVPETDRSEGYAILFRRDRFQATIGELPEGATPRTEASVTAGAQQLDARLVAWLETGETPSGDPSAGAESAGDEDATADAGAAEDGDDAAEGGRVAAEAGDAPEDAGADGAVGESASDVDISDEDALATAAAALLTAVAIGMLSMADAAPLLSALGQHSRAGDLPDASYHDVGGFTGVIVDMDGDGLADVVMSDTDGDGYADVVSRRGGDRVPAPAGGPAGDGTFEPLAEDSTAHDGTVPDAGTFEPIGDDSTGTFEPVGDDTAGTSEPVDAEADDGPPNAVAADDRAPAADGSGGGGEEADGLRVDAQEIEDIYRRGLAAGRSLDDLREDVAGLSTARGGSGVFENPFGLEMRPTAVGDVPLTPEEFAEYNALKSRMRDLDRQREVLKAEWDALLAERARATDEEMTVVYSDIRAAAALAELWDVQSDYDSRIETERAWIQTYRRWARGDTWYDAPDGSSFYDENPPPPELQTAIARREEQIRDLTRERLSAINATGEAAREKIAAARLDRLAQAQDELLHRRRALDQQRDLAQMGIGMYESYSTGRWMP